MARYGAKFTLTAVSSAFKTAGALRAPGSGMRRIRLYDFTFGFGGTPADNACEVNIVRTTANGTDTPVTPQALDPADAACAATFGKDASAEPTVTANSDLFELKINQRASYRWICAPGGELVIPATANNGLALRALSPAYTGDINGEIFFEE